MTHRGSCGGGEPDPPERREGRRDRPSELTCGWQRQAADSAAADSQAMVNRRWRSLLRQTAFGGGELAAGLHGGADAFTGWGSDATSRDQGV
jgi:hypothetical protein